jgi:hypothetical protein
VLQRTNAAARAARSLWPSQLNTGTLARAIPTMPSAPLSSRQRDSADPIPPGTSVELGRYVTVVRVGPSVARVAVGWTVIACFIGGTLAVALFAQPGEAQLLSAPVLAAATCSAIAWSRLSTTCLEFTRQSLRVSRRVLGLGWSKVWVRSETRQVWLIERLGIFGKPISRRSLFIRGTIRLLLPTQSPAALWVGRAIASWACATLTICETDHRLHRRMREEIYTIDTDGHPMSPAFRLTFPDSREPGDVPG